MKKYKIYKLVDPRIIDENDPKKVRYIGWTNKKLSDRLSNHVTEAKHDATQQHTHKNRWINCLLKLNLRPEIQFVDDTDDPEEIKNMEIKYIQQFKDGGFLLTNATKGGDGMLGRVVPDEQKAQFEKAIDVYSKTGELLYTFKSQMECEKQLGVKSEKVSMVCNGKRKSTGNYVFRFKGDPFDKYETKSMKGKNSPLKIQIQKTTADGMVILETYPSISECAQQENINKSTLQSYLKLDPFDSKGNRRMCKGRYFTKKIQSNPI